MCNKIFQFATAFVFCCDAKQSDILQGSSCVDCDLIPPLHLPISAIFWKGIFFGGEELDGKG